MVSSVSTGFLPAEMRDRAFYRSAWNVRHMWEETGHSDSRVFIEPIVPNAFVLVGRSPNGAYKEHVVPRVLICEECHRMFERDSSDEALHSVARFIGKFLKVVLITQEEQRRLDYELGLKQRMPDGWTFETGSVFARLEAACIRPEWTTP